MKFSIKNVLLISSVLILCLVGVVLVLYRHYNDYNSSHILRKKNPSFASQKMKNVSSLSPIQHVFVIVEENHDWKTIYKNTNAPYINNTLLTQGAYAQEYYNTNKNLSELHPSEPNYIMLEAGMIRFPDNSFTTDKSPDSHNSTSSHDHLTYLLDKKGYSWKSYQEDISGNDCPINQINNYAPKHNPFIYFQDVSGNPPIMSNSYCQEHIRPFDELQKDVSSGNVANYTFITPNLQHDMHDGTIGQADTWLSQVVPMITDSQTFKKNGVLFITWDEGNEGANENNPLGMIIESPYGKKQYTNTVMYSHVSLLKTIEEIFHLSPLLGSANDIQTNDLSDFFTVNKRHLQ